MTNRMGSDAKRQFLRGWVHSLYFLLRKINWVAVFLTLTLTWLLLWAASAQDNRASWAGLSQSTWAAVTGSVFAAAVFLLIQSIIRAAEMAETTLESKYYDQMANDHGFKDAFRQRGSSDIVQLYKDIITGARQRVWAFGMSNRNFFDQHESTIISLIQNRTIDVVIAFWNPYAQISVVNAPASFPARKPLGLLETQSRLEDAAGTDWASVIEDRQREFLSKVDLLRSRKGQLRIAYLTIPTNITCLVVDDELFFFPFLAGVDSTSNPTIRCSANTGLGECITSHFQKLLANDFAAQIIETRLSNRI